MSSISRAFIRGGPRKQLHFNPTTLQAAIVTCGGLCPRLNAIIRELVHSLYYMYDIQNVYGIQGGFHGFHYNTDTKTNLDLQPIVLTNEMVANIHHDGGTILKSSRGGFDSNVILNFIQSYHIQQLYIIGGDGTHRVRMHCSYDNIS
jgi:6-phosphofructokinase 1